MIYTAYFYVTKISNTQTEQMTQVSIFKNLHASDYYRLPSSAAVISSLMDVRIVEQWVVFPAVFSIYYSVTISTKNVPKYYCRLRAVRARSNMVFH